MDGYTEPYLPISGTGEGVGGQQRRKLRERAVMREVWDGTAFDIPLESDWIGAWKQEPHQSSFRKPLLSLCLHSVEIDTINSSST